MSNQEGWVCIQVLGNPKTELEKDNDKQFHIIDKKTTQMCP